MPVKSCLVGVTLILTLGAAQAATEKCPAKSTQMDETPACDRAMKVFGLRIRHQRRRPVWRGRERRNAKANFASAQGVGEAGLSARNAGL
jgi:hypothetical protein